MKVLSLPAELAFAEPDYRNYNSEIESARELEHRKSIVEWLRKNGYRGKRTGEILLVPHADGHAQYMYAEGSSRVLLHLPYGDAWHSPYVERMTRADVERSIDRSKAIAALFAK